MSGLPWGLALAVFAVSFATGLVVFVLIGRRRLPVESEPFRLFEPPAAGRFRLLRVEMPSQGALRATPIRDFDTLEEAKAEAVREMEKEPGKNLVYFSVIDSGGNPVFVREEKSA